MAKVGKGFRTMVEFELPLEMAFIEQEGHQGALEGWGWVKRQHDVGTETEEAVGRITD